MKAYKPVYEKEEIDDLLEWFAERYDRLPPEIALDEATRIIGMPETARKLCEMVEDNRHNATFGACIRHVFWLRDRLQEDYGL